MRRKTKKTVDLYTRSGTLGEPLKYVVPRVDTDPNAALNWPPDVFAIVASILSRTGTYSCICERWPPRKSLNDWCAGVTKLGKDWRASWRLGRQSQPQPEVLNWWEILKARSDAQLAKVSSDEQLCHALLQLAAAADEACLGIGIPPRKDDFEDYATLLLRGSANEPSTLCSGVIDSSKVRVLPKLHTPDNGLTIRSISHHLALVLVRDVDPVWRQAVIKDDARTLNVLLVPWPKRVLPDQFQPAPSERMQCASMPAEFGLFRYQPVEGKREIIPFFRSLLDRAKRLVGGIDVVVIPELAITPAQHEGVRDLLFRLGEDIILIAGVCGPAKTVRASTRNYIAIDIIRGKFHFGYIQRKHHRWRLDRSQIVQYGLGGNLSPTRPTTSGWWEDCEMGDRRLLFVSISSWLTFCALLCEDLARQDPVAEVIRSVGPNLVVALLMDGPQLPSRWPGRYASVLADDPGCSVLTLTSAGMMRLSRPPVGTQASNAVALWKDARRKEAVPIELPFDSDGVVLSLAGDRFEEFTADGRRDDAMAAFPILAGVHPVRSSAD